MDYLKYIKKDAYLKLVLLHIGIGTLLVLFKPLSTVLFIALMVYFTIQIISASSSKKTIRILQACAYFVGAEVLFRMTGGGLAYEASKYLVILFMLIGIISKGVSSKSLPYFFYLMLLLPSIIIASMTLSFDANFRTNVMFVLSGPLALGMSAIFCCDKRIKMKQLHQVLLYLLLPCIATTTYLFLYTPSVKEIITNTASNYATSGGFGPNQVSTVLGLGMFVLVVRLFMKSPTLFLKCLNVFLLGAMSYRAIITFSRGGIFAALIIIIVFLFFLYKQSSKKQRVQIITSFFLLLIAAVVTWGISSSQTSGLIDKRYANQDALGREKEDLTTGRSDLFIDELEGFFSNPFFGLGASRAKDARLEKDGVEIASHNEVGRLIAEHGLLGIIILIILILTPLVYRTSNKNNVFFYSFLCFWFATINHSGMRIAAPSFIYALTLLYVIYEKNPLHRKQLKA